MKRSRRELLALVAVAAAMAPLSYAIAHDEAASSAPDPNGAYTDKQCPGAAEASAKAGIDVDSYRGGCPSAAALAAVGAKRKRILNEAAALQAEAEAAGRSAEEKGTPIPDELLQATGLIGGS